MIYSEDPIVTRYLHFQNIDYNSNNCVDFGNCLQIVVDKPGEGK